MSTPLPKPDQATIDSIKAAHPGVQLHLIRAKEHHVIVRSPSAEAWKKYRRYTADRDLRSRAADALFRDCLIHPSAEAMDSILQGLPGLAETFGGELIDLAGMIPDTEIEKKAL